MRNCDYGLATPQNHRLKTSILVRPKSQQARISLGEVPRSPPLVFQEDICKKSFQSNTAANEYYIQNNIPKNSSSKQISTSFRKIGQADSEGLKLQKLRKFISEKIERGVCELREMIFRQSGQIMQLQKVIQRQDRQIENKNAIIQSIIQKYKKLQTPSSIVNQDPPNESFFMKKLNDIEQRLRLLTDQFQEEKSDLNGKMDLLTQKVISNLGSRLGEAKKAVISFMKSKEKEIAELQTLLMQNENGLLVEPFLRNSKDMKSSTNGSVRDTCSSANNSKESLHSERGNSKIRRDQSIFSDYFFHPHEPSQIESPNIKLIGELVKEREQLPIRVFKDGEGRFKYWQSRTYLFDRKGNFLSASESEMQTLERKGWLKLVASD